jgi:diacylglycerol kinase (ATP)
MKTTVNKTNVEKRFTPASRWKSFRYAAEGLRYFFRSEPNARIHLAATIIVALLVILLPISAREVLLLVWAVGFVWVTELLNTAIEKAMDIISKEYHPVIKTVKDISAASVLLAALVALVTGCFIFIPKL